VAPTGPGHFLKHYLLLLKQERAGSLTAQMNFGLRPPTSCFTPNLI